MTNAGIRNRLKQNIASKPSSSHSPRFSDLFITRFITPKIHLSVLLFMRRQFEEHEDDTADNKNPDPSGSGLEWIGWRVRLVGACRKQLAVAQAVHVTEQ